MDDQPTTSAADRVQAFIDAWDAAYPLDVTGILADIPASYNNRLVPTRELMKTEVREVLAELAAIRDSRVREVRAAHAAGWLDHGAIIAERIQLGFDVRETAGQAYVAGRIRDWHETTETN